VTYDAADDARKSYDLAIKTMRGRLEDSRAMLDMSTGNRVHSIKERGDDLYETPAVAIRALLKLECIPLTVWEPACGPGAIVRELRDSGRAVVATDLVDYGCPQSIARRDFLMESEAPAGVPAIVTNPPFKLAEEFAEKAIDLCPEVYMLMRVAFLEGLRWEKLRLRDHLARVWVFAPRLPMMHRAGWDGPVNSNSGMAFGWFCFQRNWALKGGQPTVDWVNWKTMFKETEAT
jgi:hypothetical protein